MDAPLVSVITAVLNDREGFSSTLASVRSQNYPNIEHIAIDGGSSDGTAELIRDRAQQFAHWSSEPDRGVSDAFNKGLAAARGQWVNFLNAGDTFESLESVARAATHFEGRHIVTGFARFGNRRLPGRIRRTSERLAKRALVSHQASFVHRRVFDECGGFDLDYRIRMDYEFWLRAFARFDFLFLDEFLARFELGGVSSRERDRYFEEELRANRQHLAYPRIENALARSRRAMRSMLVRSRAVRLWRGLHRH